MNRLYDSCLIIVLGCLATFLFGLVLSVLFCMARSITLELAAASSLQPSRNHLPPSMGSGDYVWYAAWRANNV